MAKAVKTTRKIQSAGVADIRFSEKISVPSREGNIILLPPLSRNCHIFRLQKGRQFLFVMVYFNKTLNPGNAYYWLGTDENAFLVRITYEAFRAFYKRGEKAFYHYVKPTLIKELERISKDARVLRQGDIWAFPVADVSLNSLRLLIKTLRKNHQIVEGKQRRVLGTMHTVKGVYFTVNTFLERAITFVEGTLESPDHKPLELKGIHVLAQTRGLSVNNL
jgi:hypothetical protein